MQVLPSLQLNFLQYLLTMIVFYEFLLSSLFLSEWHLFCFLYFSSFAIEKRERRDTHFLIHTSRFFDFARICFRIKNIPSPETAALLHASLKIEHALNSFLSYFRPSCGSA